MSVNPTKKELDESINALSMYRDRLKKELISLSQKLHMPQKQIDMTLRENTELQKVEKTLSSLIRENQKL